MNQNSKVNIKNLYKEKCISLAKWALGNKNVYVKNLITKEVSWITAIEYWLQSHSNKLVRIAQINCKKIK